MNKKSRYFIFGAVAFLVLGLSIGLFGYYRGFGALVGAQVPGFDELKYVPSNATLVAYADVKSVMGSQFRQRMRMLEPAGKEEGQAEFRAQTGIDIENDINHVVAYLAPGDGTDKDKVGVALVTGTKPFDRNRIESLIESKGGRVEKVNGRTLLLIGPETVMNEADVPPEAMEQMRRHRHPEEMALSFLADDVVAVGNTMAVRKAIDRSAGVSTETDVRKNAEMMKMIDNAASGNAWVVGRFDSLANQAHLPNDVMSRIPPIKWFSASGEVDGGLSGTVTVQTVDQAAAENLRKVVDGMAGLAGMWANQNAKEMNSLVSSLKVGGNGDTVAVSFSLPLQALDALKNMPRHRRDGRELPPEK